MYLKLMQLTQKLFNLKTSTVCKIFLPPHNLYSFILNIKPIYSEVKVYSEDGSYKFSGIHTRDV